MSTDHDDPWADDKRAGPPSAFSGTTVLEAEDVTDKAQHDGTDYGQSQFAEESALAKPKAGANIAILAVAGLLGLGVLGGVGFYVKQKFLSKGQTQQQTALALETAQPLPVSVFDGAPKGPANVMDTADSSKLAASAPVLASLPASAVPAAAVVALAASAPASVMVPASAAAAPMAITPAPVAAVAPAPPASAPAKAMQADVPARAQPPAAAVVASNSPKQEKASAASDVATAVPAKAADTPKASKPVRVKKPATSTARAKAQPAGDKVADAKESSTPRATSAQKEPRRVRSTRVARASKRGEDKTLAAETVLLPSGLKVQSIFPQSGPNAQAWILDAAGKTQIVRVGDALRGGPVVTQIVGEKGQVVTGSGVITTRGARE